MLESLSTLPVAAVAALAVAVLLGGLAWRMRASRAAAAEASTGDAVDTLIGWAPQVTRVLTTGELRAHAMLAQALPQHIILAQVSLARFIKVPTRNSYAEWLRRVGHLSADLVVCDAQSQVLAVVEVRSLRERGGDRAERRQQRFARVLKAVGIPLHVWVENAIPSVDELRRIFAPPAAAAAPVVAAAVAVSPAAVRAAPAEAPAAAPAPAFDNSHYPPADEVIEMREPPSTTWFDDFDSGVAPLDPPRSGSRK